MKDVKQKLLQEFHTFLERKDMSKGEYILFVTSFILLLVLALSSVHHYVGFATIHNATAGTIYEVILERTFPTDNWQGIYGLALRVDGFTQQLSVDANGGVISREDIFFNCIESGVSGGNEVYVSTAANISFDNLTAGTVEEFDNFMNVTTGGGDSANNTFTNFTNITVGGTTITNIPATFTYKSGVPDNSTFNLGILNDSVNLVLVTNIQDVQSGYVSTVTVNYQMMLPTPANTTTTYYFFTDPNDECPPGGIGNTVNATVYGIVNDSTTAGLDGVLVTVAGFSTLTNASGFYNLSYSVIPGTYTFLAQKSGYDTFISNVTVTFQNFTEEKDVTMNLTAPTFNASLIQEVTVFGTVTNAADGSAIEDANVSFATGSDQTDADGNYSINVTVIIGEQNIIATKENFDNYINNLSVNSSTSSIQHDIQMVTANPFETGPLVPIVEEKTEGVEPTPPARRVEEGSEVFISVTEIKRKLPKNTFVDYSVTVHNYQGQSVNLNLDITGDAAQVIGLDRDNLNIGAGEFDSFLITVYGYELGRYTGNLVVTGDLEGEIPIDIQVVENQLPIEILLMDVDLLQKSFIQGDLFNFRLSLRNLLTDQSYDVGLAYKVIDPEGNILIVEEDNVKLETDATLVQAFNLPDVLEEGEYTLLIEARYLDRESALSHKFSIRKPFHLQAFLGIPVWLLMLIIGLIATGVFATLLIRRHIESKKRYHSTMNYKLLPQAGPRSLFVGRIAETKVKAYIDMDKLTVHGIVAGATGRGKSVAAQDIIEECLSKDIGVIVVDPTAQWSGMLRKCEDKKMMSFYPAFGMKPQDARAFNGNVRQIKDAREQIDLKKYMKPGEIQIFATNRIDPKDMDLFVANLIRQFFAMSLQEQRELKYMLVFDEVHRLLPRFGGSGQGFLQVERCCREFRKWGIGVLLISQVLSDFVGEIKANINTEVQTRTTDESDLERIKTKYGEDVLQSLVKASVGVAMVQNAEYNKGVPYFINFRPIQHSVRRLSDEELEKYNKYNDIIEDLEYQIEQLEEDEKIDVFDLKLELKLALDKVKSGNFNMVDIYLEGLKPRIEGQWKKLGKTPKKKELKLASQEEIEASIKKAEAEHDKVEKEEEENKEEEEKEKEDILRRNVKPFTFENGMMIANLKELQDVLEVVDDDVYKSHVNEEKDEIGTWIKDNFEEEISSRFKDKKEKKALKEELDKFEKEQTSKDEKKEEGDKDET